MPEYKPGDIYYIGEQNSGIVTKLETVAKEYAIYLLVYYQHEWFLKEDCSIYRISEGPDVLVGQAFVSLDGTLFYSTFNQRVIDTSFLCTSVAIEPVIGFIIKVSENQLEQHFNQLYEVG